MEDRLIEMETKIAFQEDSIQKLTEASNRHEKDIYQLTCALKSLRDHLANQGDSQLQDPKEEPPPPHY
jgi:SlyX protein